MPSEVDNLEVKVKGDSESANKSLDQLIEKFDKLENVMLKAYGASKNGRLAPKVTATQTKNIDTLVEELHKLEGVSAKKLNAVANAVEKISKSLIGMKSVGLGISSATKMAKQLTEAKKLSESTQTEKPKDFFDDPNWYEKATGKIKNELPQEQQFGINVDSLKEADMQLKSFSNYTQDMSQKVGKSFNEMTFSQEEFNSMLNAGMKKSYGYMEGFSSKLGITEKTAKESFDGISQASNTIQPEKLDNLNGNIKRLSLNAKIASINMGLLKDSSENIGNENGFSNKIIDMNKKIRLLHREMKTTSDTIKNVFSSPLKAIGTALKPLSNGFKKMSDGIGDIKKKMSILNLGKFMSFILMWQITIAVFDGMVQNLNNLAVYSDKAGTQFNKSMSSMYSALKQLQAALATAFEPIINVIAPYITTLINYLTAGANALAQFFSALTGSSTWTKATYSAQNYANSVSNATDATKDLQKATLGIDEINVLGSNSSSGGSSANSDTPTGSGLSTEKVANQFSDFAKMIKDAWSNADFTQIGAIVGEKLNNALEKIDWSKINSTLEKIAKSVATFLNGFISTVDWTLVGTTIGNGIDAALNFADTYINTLNWSKVGDAIANTLNGILSMHPFTNLAKTIADGINAAVTTLFSFSNTFDWTSAGNEIANSINTFFSTIDWIKAGKTFSKLITGLEKTIYNSIKGIDWQAMGNDVADFLKNIDWAKALSGIINIGTVTLGATIDFTGGLTGGLQSGLLQGILGTKSPVGNANFDFINFITGGKLKKSDYEKSLKEFADETGKAFNPANWLKSVGSDINQASDPNISYLDTIKSRLSNLSDQWNNLFGTQKSQGTGESTLQLWWEQNDFPGIAKDISNWWTNDIAPIFSLDNVKDTVSGIKQGIEETWQNVVAWWHIDVGNWWDNDVAPWFTIEKWSETVKPIGDSIENTWNDFKNWWENSAIVVWWNNDVLPWFTADKWNALYDNIKTQIQLKWNDIVTWWNNTAIVSWWNNNVSPWFTKDKWSGLYDTIKTGIQDKWNEVTNWWNNLGPVKWFNDTVLPMFSKDKWSFSGISEGLKQAFNNAVDGMKQIWNTFADFLNSKLNFSWDSVKVLGKEVVPSGNINLGKIPKFSTGGFPEDGMFMANSNELVGKFTNGRTAVANNNQIVDGIASGVTDAMMNVYMATNRNQNQNNQSVEIPIYLDGKEIARSTATNLNNMVRNGQIVLNFI